MKKALLGLIGAGSLLLAVAQFLPLFHTHVSSQTAALGSGSVGASHAYLVLPLALLAVILGWGAVATGSRFALVLVGVVGAAVLAIALGHDLSHARDHGLDVLGINDYAEATNQVAVGLYVEIAGALVLLIATVGGFLLAGPALYQIARGATASHPATAAGPAASARFGTGADGQPRRRSRSETIGRRYDDD